MPVRLRQVKVGETYARVFFAARPPDVPKPARELTPSCDCSRENLRQANMVRVRSASGSGRRWLRVDTRRV